MGVGTARAKPIIRVISSGIIAEIGPAIILKAALSIIKDSQATPP